MLPFGEEHAAHYDTSFSRLNACNAALHLTLELALEGLPEDAQVLVVGAGTGRELLSMAAEHPEWRFVAVDPSPHMLDIARAKIEAAGCSERVHLHVGTLDTYRGAERFDAATAILVSQFTAETSARTTFFREIADRLHPGGKMVAADLSEDRDPERRPLLMGLWMNAMGRAQAPHEAKKWVENFGKGLSVVDSEAVQLILQEAGFERTVEIFQFGMIRAWLAER